MEWFRWGARLVSLFFWCSSYSNRHRISVHYTPHLSARQQKYLELWEEGFSPRMFLWTEGPHGSCTSKLLYWPKCWWQEILLTPALNSWSVQVRQAMARGPRWWKASVRVLVRGKSDSIVRCKFHFSLGLTFSHVHYWVSESDQTTSHLFFLHIKKKKKS